MEFISMFVSVSLLLTTSISILFFFFCLRWVFIAVHGLSLVAASGGYSSLHSMALGMQASVVVACGLSNCGSWALEHRLSSCGARA